MGADETLVTCGDLNGYIGKLANGYDGVHGGYGYGLRNKEGEHILEFVVAHNLAHNHTPKLRMEVERSRCSSQIPGRVK